ncbi:MAG TPA: TetR/AcrR family transcriptional regulator [Pseudonocardiaceae bacterium]|nr:TetR/AcrR family transcriptional regulator [Pseudonocardiaceae bacterium]
MGEQPDSARPGRKRSETSRQAILTAAAELFGEVGYAGLTIEGIAARAGTGKQTIYRWWPSKADVLLDALADKTDLQVPIPDEGSFAADLRAFLAASFALGRYPQVREVLRAVMAQAQVDVAFGERFRNGFVRRRRDALSVLVDRADAKGELPEGVPASTIMDVVFGVIWYRLLVPLGPLDEGLPDELVALLAGSPSA